MAADRRRRQRDVALLHPEAFTGAISPDAAPGTSLFHPVFCDTTYQNFRAWVNGPSGQRLGLAPLRRGR